MRVAKLQLELIQQGSAVVVPASGMTPSPVGSAGGGAIEIEFAAGLRMRITGPVDAAMQKAVVAAWFMDSGDVAVP